MIKNMTTWAYPLYIFIPDIPVPPSKGIWLRCPETPDNLTFRFYWFYFLSENEEPSSCYPSFFDVSFVLGFNFPSCEEINTRLIKSGSEFTDYDKNSFISAIGKTEANSNLTRLKWSDKKAKELGMFPSDFVKNHI